MMIELMMNPLCVLARFGIIGLAFLFVGCLDLCLWLPQSVVARAAFRLVRCRCECGPQLLVHSSIVASPALTTNSYQLG